MSLAGLYMTHDSIMCYLVSSTPHAWQLSCPSSKRCRRDSVSLEPSHPVLILKMYLISCTLCLLVLMYVYVVCLYPIANSQNSFIVGNSLSVYVLFLALSIIYCEMYLLIAFFQFIKLPLLMLSISE